MKVTTSIGKQGSGGTWEQRMLGIDFTKTANTPPKYTLYLPGLSRPCDLALQFHISARFLQDLLLCAMTPTDVAVFQRKYDFLTPS